MSIFGRLYNRKRQVQEKKESEHKSAQSNAKYYEEVEDAGADKEKDTLVKDPSDEQETYEAVEIEIHPAKIICPDCGGITLEGLELCDKCGGELN